MNSLEYIHLLHIMTMSLFNYAKNLETLHNYHFFKNKQLLVVLISCGIAFEHTTG